MWSRGGNLAGLRADETQSGDTVDGMVHYGLDAMLLYTVTMGLVAFLMAWVIIVIAVKGWAVRREARRPLST